MGTGKKKRVFKNICLVEIKHVMQLFRRTIPKQEGNYSFVAPAKGTKLRGHITAGNVGVK